MRHCGRQCTHARQPWHILHPNGPDTVQLYAPATQHSADSAGVWRQCNAHHTEPTGCTGLPATDGYADKVDKTMLSTSHADTAGSYRHERESGWTAANPPTAG